MTYQEALDKLDFATECNIKLNAEVKQLRKELMIKDNFTEDLNKHIDVLESELKEHGYILSRPRMQAPNREYGIDRTDDFEDNFHSDGYQL